MKMTTVMLLAIVCTMYHISTYAMDSLDSVYCTEQITQHAESGDAVALKSAIDKGGYVQVKTGVFLETALHKAARLGHLDVVKALIDAKMEIDVRDKQGRTALHWAALKGDDSIEVVKLLIAAGADVNAEDFNGVTALGRAVGTHPKTVEVLILAGADSSGIRDDPFIKAVLKSWLVKQS